MCILKCVIQCFKYYQQFKNTYKPQTEILCYEQCFLIPPSSLEVTCMWLFVTTVFSRKVYAEDLLAHHSLNCQIIFQSTFVLTFTISLTVSIHFLAVRQNDAVNMWRCSQFFQEVTKKSHSVVGSFPPFPLSSLCP